MRPAGMAAASVSDTLYSISRAWSVAIHGLNGVTIVSAAPPSDFDHITIPANRSRTFFSPGIPKRRVAGKVFWH
jgi:hypothetical protein